MLLQRFILWDEDALFPNDEIGRCEISTNELAPDQVHDVWLDVVNVDEKEREKTKHGEGATKGSKRTNALMKIAVPVAGHSTKGCQLVCV